MDIFWNFWKRAPWYLWVLATINICIAFLSDYWWFGIIDIFAWAFVVPSAIYLIDDMKK